MNENSPEDPKKKVADHPTDQIYVFISYSSRNSKTAKAIAKDLKQLGIPHFLDKKDIQWGKSINKTIREALKISTHQIIIVSPASLKSAWVHFESGYGIGRGATTLPFLTDPDLDLPGYMNDLEYKTSRKDLQQYFRTFLESHQKERG